MTDDNQHAKSTQESQGTSEKPQKEQLVAKPEPELLERPRAPMDNISLLGEYRGTGHVLMPDFDKGDSMAEQPKEPAKTPSQPKPQDSQRPAAPKNEVAYKSDGPKKKG